MTRRTIVLVVCALVALHAWFWSSLVFGDGYLAHSDLYEYFLPVFLAPGLIWSTNEFAGFPAFADPQASMWYPVHALFSRALGWWHGFVVSAYLIASIGAYAYAYTITRSVAAGMMAGIAWPLCEALAEKYPHLAMLHGWAWLPMMLVCVEQLIRHNTWRWVAAFALAVALVILTGHPQVAVYSLYLTGVYGLVGGLAERRGISFVIRFGAGFVLGAALTAAQTIPLAELSQQTARIVVGFEQFARSFAQQPQELLSAVFPQIQHEGREAPTYVGGVVALSAMLLLGSRTAGWRPVFWTVAAVVYLLLGLGDATPLAELAYQMPLYDRFRVVARHLALFSFAMVALGSLGLAAVARGEVSRWRATGLLVVAAGLVVTASSYVTGNPADFPLYEERGVTGIAAAAGGEIRGQTFLWLAGIATLLIATWWRSRVFIGLALALLTLDLANSQPVVVSAKGITPPSVLAPSDVEPSVHAVSMRQQLSTTHQRVLPFEGSVGDHYVIGAFTRRWGVPSAGGYGPLLLENLARVLEIENNGSVRPTALLHENRALDLLAVRYVIVAESSLEPPDAIEQDGYRWTEDPPELEVDQPDCGSRHPSTLSIGVPSGLRVRGVALVSHLRCSEDVAQGAVVGSITRVGVNGVRDSRPLRAGLEIAESYQHRPALRDRMQHRGAQVFDTSGEGDDARAEYLAVFEFGDAVETEAIEVTESDLHGWLTVDRVTLLAEDGTQVPVGALKAALDHRDRYVEHTRIRTSRTTDRGRDERADHETVFVVYENRRALPRAWLVPEVITLDETAGLTALRYSKRPDGGTFDPSQTAFVEPGWQLAVDAPAATERRVVVHSVTDGRIRLETAANGGGLLVVSEMYYPGWIATVDGEPRDVVRVNHAVMGVPIGPGRHAVELRFAPGSLRLGIGVSGAALLLALAMVAWPSKLDRSRS